MSSFLDLISPDTLTAVRSRFLGYARGAGLKITNWPVIGTGYQMFETAVSGAYAFASVASKYVRGFASLDTSTDPGDPDPYDPENVGLTPSPGFLSAYGENTYGTERQEASFASGFVTFTNAGPTSRTIAPEGLSFTWTVGSPPTPPPTYKNAADASVYTNPDSTLTVGVGVSVLLPVSCDIEGSFGTCPASSLSLTTTLTGCSATNAESIVGNDREDAEVYRARCRLAPARLSLGGPSAAYEYLASKNLDGTPLLNDATPPVPSGITRVWVSEDSATGIVTAYYASASGGAIADDVSAANRNIEQQCFAVPDAITFGGTTAIETSVHVVGTAKIKNRPGLDPAAVVTGIVAALAAQFPEIPIGGMDQTGGAGVLYTRDIEAIARSGYVGLYDVTVTTPAGATTALAAGHVAALDSDSADWTLTVVS